MTSASRRYDRISTAYSAIADAAEHGTREKGLALLAPRTGERVVEIGTGTGRALVKLADAVGPGGLVCGLDVSPGMLTLAREQALSPAIQLLRADARCLPCRAGEFDAAFMSFTLELFDPQDMQRVLAEIGRVLKPTGRLAVVALNAGDGFPVAAYVWLHRHFPEWIDCRPIDLVRVLAEGGYKTTRTERLELWGLAVMIAAATPTTAVRARGA
jgi:demethylmenaquinone methyltransferase/2-methoxy-6-polyprenyl-1,4-benzoquinol methylase